MSTVLYAQPYDISAQGFYFRSVEEYGRQAAGLKNDYGQPVEEFEIQFIDGELIDCELAEAIGINQANLKDVLRCVEKWDEWEKLLVTVAVEHCDHEFDQDRCPYNYKVDIHEEDGLRDLAERLVDDGMYGDIPERLQFYIDYDAIARDLAVSCFEVTIAGRRLVCESY